MEKTTRADNARSQAIADFETPIVLICCSGNRSSAPAVALLTVEFCEV